jgi:hypothetical protein
LTERAGGAIRSKERSAVSETEEGVGEVMVCIMAERDDNRWQQDLRAQKKQTIPLPAKGRMKENPETDVHGEG